MTSTEDRRKNIKEKLEKAKQASPSGTTGPATGVSGAKGSYQATGGGTTVIEVSRSGRGRVVSYSGSGAKSIPSDVVTSGGQPIMIGTEYLTTKKVEEERQKELQRRQQQEQAKLKAQIITQLGRKTGAFDVQRKTEIPEGLVLTTPKEQITVFYTGEEAVETFGKGRKPTAKFDVTRFGNIPRPEVQLVSEPIREKPAPTAEKMPMIEETAKAIQKKIPSWLSWMKKKEKQISEKPQVPQGFTQDFLSMAEYPYGRAQRMPVTGVKAWQDVMKSGWGKRIEGILQAEGVIVEETEEGAKYGGGGFYRGSEKKIVLAPGLYAYRGEILAHEAGHYFEDVGDIKIDTGLKNIFIETKIMEDWWKRNEEWFKKTEEAQGIKWSNEVKYEREYSEKLAESFSEFATRPKSFYKDYPELSKIYEKPLELEGEWWLKKPSEPTVKSDTGKIKQIDMKPSPKAIPAQDFLSMAEYPYGRAQRMPISELKMLQKRYMYQKQKISEMPEQSALLLEATQQLLKGSDEFKGLVAQRLAEQKQKYEQTKTVTAFLGGGRIEVTGEVMPFERKLPKQKAMQELLSIDTRQLPKAQAEKVETIKYGITIGKMPKLAFEYGIEKPVSFIEEKTRFIEDLGEKLPSFKDEIKQLRQETEEELRKPEFQELPLARTIERYARTGTGGLTVAYGGYEGIREHPRKAISYAFVGAALYPAKAVIFADPFMKGVGIGLAGAYGASIYARASTEPTGFRKRVRLGEILSTETVPLVAGGMAGKEALSRAAEYYAPKQIIEARMADDLTKEEARFIKGISEKASPENLALQEELGYDPDRYARIDINKLARKPAAFEKFIKLQQQGRIETAFDFSLGGMDEGKVGFEIKPRRGISELEQQARLKASERLGEILGQRSKIAFAEEEKLSESLRLRELGYEAEIRAEMERTGKSAAEIYASLKEAESDIDWTPPKIREGTGKAVSGIDRTDPFKGLGKRLSESGDRFSRLRESMGGRQKYILLYEEEYLRGMRPVSEQLEIDISGIRQYSFLKALSFESTSLVVTPFSMPAIRQVQMPKVDLMAGIRTESLAGTRVIAMTRTISIPRLSSMQQLGLGTMGKLKPLSITEQLPSIASIPIIEQEQRITPILEGNLENIQKLRPIIIPETKLPDAEIPKFRLGTKKLMGEYDLGFDVYVGRKGRMKKVNRQPLPRNRALNFGSDIVDNTVAASFEIRPSKKKARGMDDPGWNLKSKFRKPYKGKARQDFWTEENKHRIDSAGERMGLSVARYLSQMRKGFAEL